MEFPSCILKSKDKKRACGHCVETGLCVRRQNSTNFRFRSSWDHGYAQFHLQNIFIHYTSAPLYGKLSHCCNLLANYFSKKSWAKGECKVPPPSLPTDKDDSGKNIQNGANFIINNNSSS